MELIFDIGTNCHIVVIIVQTVATIGAAVCCGLCILILWGIWRKRWWEVWSSSAVDLGFESIFFGVVHHVMVIARVVMVVVVAMVAAHVAMVVVIVIVMATVLGVG